jgi:hypothetical protein
MFYTIEMELIIGVRIPIFPLEGDVSLQYLVSRLILLPRSSRPSTEGEANSQLSSSKSSGPVDDPEDPDFGGFDGGE